MTTARSFLLDENVDVRVGTFLKHLGHGVSFVPKGIRNGDVLALAVKEQRILVTHDTDFLDIPITHKNMRVAIIVLRIHPPTKEKVISAFHSFLPKMRGVVPPIIYELLDGGFRVHEESDISQKRPRCGTEFK